MSLSRRPEDGWPKAQCAPQLRGGLPPTVLRTGDKGRRIPDAKASG
jgi:hypothetical protein